jgi:addiction module RelB/DinJ family antitoxin
MGAVNVTVRIDEEVKRDFDVFCRNVGLNTTTAIHLFMRAVLRTRKLPFSISDMELQKQAASPDGKEALPNAIEDAPEQIAENGAADTAMGETEEAICEVETGGASNEAACDNRKGKKAKRGRR